MEKTDYKNLNKIQKIIGNLVILDQAEAIELLRLLEKSEKGKEWLKDGSTITLMAAAKPFRKYSIYNHRTDKMPFDNDVYALDAAMIGVK